MDENRPRIFYECTNGRLAVRVFVASFVDDCPFAGVAARAACRARRDIESLRGRMGESTRQVEGLFESLLSESFR